MAYNPSDPYQRPNYRARNLCGGNFCPGSAPNGQVTQATDGSNTQKRHAHVERMRSTNTWDSKTTPAEDPNRPGYRRPPPGKKWDSNAHEYVDI